MLSLDQLYSEVCKARELSYSPYSNFKVGAVIECSDGTLIYGANIENASYGLSMCAERNAIFQAVLRGYRKEDFIQLALVADSDIITTPCGACRQVLSEFMGRETPIISFNLQKKYLKVTVGELLPYGFNRENMEK